VVRQKQTERAAEWSGVRSGERSGGVERCLALEPPPPPQHHQRKAPHQGGGGGARGEGKTATRMSGWGGEGGGTTASAGGGGEGGGEGEEKSSVDGLDGSGQPGRVGKTDNVHNHAIGLCL